jgi:hypothetical protein
MIPLRKLRWVWGFVSLGEVGGRKGKILVSPPPDAAGRTEASHQCQKGRRYSFQRDALEYGLPSNVQMLPSR